MWKLEDGVMPQVLASSQELQGAISSLDSSQFVQIRTERVARVGKVIMTVARATRLLTQEEVKVLSPAARTEILVSEWWPLERDSPEFLKLPRPIQEAVINEETPRTPDSPMYDALLQDSLEFEYRGLRKAYVSRRLAELGFPDIAITGDPVPLFACPCCHYRSLTRRGEYDICRVCFWEDVGDCSEEKYVTVNRQTLKEARDNFVEFGACSPGALRLVDPRGREKYYRADESVV